ncbi:PAS domain S-box protein [Myxococcus xanthus]|nr:putative histidine protein kinase [Myxococcus xanthus DZ2]QPM80593.1 PAS domain S-box protein [Myxococcus xanthus]QVW69654.1 PAS domain S-box protein [Myxococcus xanthus DZ2]QZZ48460.1 Sensor histidine kinase RcsC [Myxococcus xanthus]UEO04218.1 PAS domain S-box protein [Myxococcus xanthus DZ2]
MAGARGFGRASGGCYMTTLDELTTCAGLALAPPSSTGACLILISTTTPAAIGKAYRLDQGEHIIGRGSDVTVRIDDHGVSRKHARVVRAGDGACHVTDLDSTNGTLLNGVPVSTAELMEGDRLQIGTVTVFRFSKREVLEQREEQLRQALTAARVGIWDWNAQSGRVTWSEQVDRLLGLPVGKLSGRAMELSEVVHPADLPRVSEVLGAALEKKTQVDVEYRIEPQGSGWRWISCKGDVLCDASGAPARVTGTVMDITARKLAEQELHRQSLIFESIYDGVVITDLGGGIIDWNSSAERMFGRQKSEALGQTLFSVLHPDEPDRLTGLVLTALDKQGRWSGELEFKRHDGTTCWCESVVVPLRDSEGRAIANIMVHRDTTERKQLQAHLVVADRLASVGTLGAGVAHEINNPLAYMLVNLHLIREGLERLESQAPAAPVASLQQLVRETAEGAERIATIVRDLKVFARGEQETRLMPVDVRRAVELACKMADNVIRHRARLVTEFEPVAPVEASESRLCQVFLNLLLNAAQAIPEEGTPGVEHEIRVVIRAGEKDRVVVEVRDTGMGMGQEVLGRIFDPFFTTKPVGVGTGLGLSICHGIIESMGGSIQAESEPGRGSTFRVVLCAATRELEVLPRLSATMQANVRARILVVDDEPNVTLALQRSLAADHEVSTANSAQAALRLVSDGGRFDLILCDVMMPGMTGMDLYHELGRCAPEQAGRMVFMTGGAFTPRTVSFLRDVPNAKIAKPLDLMQLRELVGRSAEAGR